MLVVTSKHHGNVNVITVVFQSLQTEGFCLLPHEPIPSPALKGFTKHRCLTHFCSLQNSAAQQTQTAIKRPATPESHTVHTCFLR